MQDIKTPGFTITMERKEVDGQTKNQIIMEMMKQDMQQGKLKVDAMQIPNRIYGASNFGIGNMDNDPETLESDQISRN